VATFEGEEGAVAAAKEDASRQPKKSFAKEEKFKPFRPGYSHSPKKTNPKQPTRRVDFDTTNTCPYELDPTLPVAQAAYLAYGLYMPQFHTEAPQQHITEEEWQLHNSYNAILNDLEDALTGQRLLDLPIVQTYEDIVEQSKAHIRAVQTRIQAVTKITPTPRSRRRSSKTRGGRRSGMPTTRRRRTSTGRRATPARRSSRRRTTGAHTKKGGRRI
jgi:hypothetical protein